MIDFLTAPICGWLGCSLLTLLLLVIIVLLLVNLIRG